MNRPYDIEANGFIPYDFVRSPATMDVAVCRLRWRAARAEAAMSISSTQQGYLYYAADWEVSPVTSADLTHLIRTVGKLGLLLFTQGSRRAEDGFFKVIFVLRAASEEVLAQFVQEAGERINLIHWTAISEETFYGAPFLGSRIVGFVEASQIYGRANAVLRERRSAQN